METAKRTIYLTRKGAIGLAVQRTILDYYNPKYLSEEDKATIIVVDTIRSN